MSLEIEQDRKMAEECLTPLERLLAQGKELGYSGDDLRKFVEGQQRAERDERAERRKFELEQLERAQMKRETELALKEKELELERLKSERENDAASSVSFGGNKRCYAPRPKLPKFCEASDSIDAYILAAWRFLRRVKIGPKPSGR